MENGFCSLVLNHFPLLVFSQSFHPYFRLYTDGQKAFSVIPKRIKNGELEGLLVPIEVIGPC